ncbi:MAG: glycosyltransferase, partial [Bacteroidetes bacterium]|nr:glycosyltransferase [Bacteroidota bacterium]
MIFLKNIVIIGPAHPLRGGIAAFNERLAGALLEAGYHVRIETFSLQYPGFLFPGKTQYSASPPPDVPDICVSVNSVNPFNWMRTGKKIRNEKPDMILTAFWMPFMGPCLGTLAGIIRKNRHSKVVALVHNFIPHEKHPGDKAFTRYFSRRMDGYIAMSKAVLKDIQSFDKSKPAVFSPHPLYDHYGK